MITILTEAKSKTVINRSKFIGFVFNCDNLDKRNEILKQLRNEFFDADHICFAHIFWDKNYFVNFYTDDKEPAGTAGLQILNCLKKHNIVNVLAVVVRYFGGVKLGVQNLSKAYRECIQEAINQIKTKPAELRTKCKIECDYITYNKINKLLSDLKKYKIEFNKLIKFEIMLDNEQILKLQELDLQLTITNEKCIY